MRIIEVDGEQFKVEADPTDSHQLNFTWITGPNPCYGFSSGSYDTGVLATGDASGRLERSIRNFLSQIDAATGYID